MIPRWALLGERDRDVFRVVTAFLFGRMAERNTLDWALHLKRSELVKRLALLDLVDSPEGQKVAEPWQSAWRLVEESWEQPVAEDASVEVYHVKRRLQSGDRSGALVKEIVQLVKPRLSVEPLSALRLYTRKIPRRPKRIADLLSTRLTSGEIIDPNILELSKFSDRSFLVSLANALQSAISGGLDIARRIGWDGKRRFWQLGQLHRVYYVPAAELSAGEHEPDQFHRGIAPSVKLLHSIIARLVDIEISVSLEFARRWRSTECPVHLRLWTALSRDARISSPAEVGDFLLSLSDLPFWNVHDFPEIAELRAKRFSELDAQEQTALIARIRKRPPRNHWPKLADAQKVERGRLYWAVRELRRIELAGAALPAADKNWLDSTIVQFPELAQMSRVDEGFLAAAKATWVPPEPDNRFDSLTGEARLSALEVALSSTRTAWDENPAKGAEDWMRQLGSLMNVLSDLEAVTDAGSAFPQVWNQFGWAHAMSLQQSGGTELRQLPAEAARVLALLTKLPEETTRRSIEGISEWLSAWRKQIVAVPDYQAVWHRLWPLAVEATNAQQPATETVDLNTVARGSDDSEPMDLDTLNTPAGRLVGLFLEACFSAEPNAHPFQADGVLLAMRHSVMDAQGRTAVIVRHRLIEYLPYFLSVDPDWTQEHLVAPLMSESAEALALWRAIARQTQFLDVLKIVGEQMTERAVKRDLGRETRQSLVFSLMVECLWALQEGREPAVPYPRVQQMIRSLDDEVRAHAADTIQRFVANVPASPQGKTLSLTPESVFRGSAAPFLARVWPQERSLVTPGVSRALAHLPAATKGAFAEAVNAIDRFLVPFDCWSMLDYGLYGEEEGEAKLSSIDNEVKAAALLQLLDLTIGTSEAAVVPYDLPSALDQIQNVSPQLVDLPVFRRLAAAARRA